MPPNNTIVSAPSSSTTNAQNQDEGLYTEAPPTTTRPNPPPPPPSSPPPASPRTPLVRRGCCGCPPVRHVRHAPAFQHVPHIKLGYRVGFELKHCFLSLFTFHNESINIWSHLIGAAYVGRALYRFIQRDGLHPNMEEAEFTAILTFLLCAMACLSFSTFYHLFGCHSPEMFNFLLRVDFIGIALLIWGSYIPGIHYAFYCFPWWQRVYQGITVVNLTLGMVGAAFTDAYCPRQSKFRNYTFALLVVFGLVPTCHFCWLVPAHVRGMFLDNLLGMFLAYGLGFTFWATRFPECWAPPGRFDLLFSSHQLWHLCIFVAVVVWLNGLMEYHHVLHELGCGVLLKE